MDKVTVDSVKALFDQVARVRDQEGWRDALLRGQRDPEWSLEPGLFRFARGRSPRRFDHGGLSPEVAAAYELESEMFFDFDSRSRRETGDDGSGWEALFHMQHHGAPTRLLDWTQNLLVSMFFATHEWPTGRRLDGQPAACVWVLAPSLLNQEAVGVGDLMAPEYFARLVGHRYTGRWSQHKGESKEPRYDGYRDLLATCTRLIARPVALFPNVLNYRMRAQQGTFVLFGEDTRPLEVQAPDVVARIDLTREAVAEAQQFLERAGVNIYSVNPDLDGLAAWLRLR